MPPDALRSSLPITYNVIQIKTDFRHAIPILIIHQSRNYTYTTKPAIEASSPQSLLATNLILDIPIQ